MRPLRVVLVMVEPPLPFGTAAARWYYVLLRGLVQRGHRVTAFAVCSNPADVERAASIFPAPIIRHRSPGRRSVPRYTRASSKPGIHATERPAAASAA